ncbi:hypothetical protein [Hyunsoonleella aestuarii]|uniref:T9SS type A sorting domain-containing protein n=1 Tax=Hyunsoonleella aestuarii TaxID=912802 RepID=A0ABP8EEN9_9FLAO|nr:hypothetical protein [Hyunsoonleella aestuarii]
MTKITRLCFIALLFVFSNGIAKPNAIVDNSNSTYVYNNIQRVRIDFKMPDGFTRHLLLAFTKNNAASDAYDYGYDALNQDAFPYDLNWLVDEQRCTIQGVGAFDDTKKYPFWMFMSQSGDIEISLDRLEYFDSLIDIFVYDSLLDEYYQINDESYKKTIESGEYSNRFYLAFKSEETSESIAKSALSTSEVEIATTSIKFLNNSKELYVQTNSEIKEIIAYNIQGQKLLSFNSFNNNSTKIPLSNLNIKNHVIVTVKTDIGLTTRQLFIMP